MSFLLKKYRNLYIIKIGDSMKKILGMLIILFAIYLGVQVVFNIFGKGYEYEYVVTTGDIDYNVKEIRTRNTDGEVDNYYFEIRYDNNEFFYQTLQEFDVASKAIDDIYSYKSGTYNCILPVFSNDSFITDIMCNKDSITYYYHDLIGTEAGLDDFANSLASAGYDKNQWTDSATSTSRDNISVYKDNMLKNHYVALTNYKGVYILTANDIKNISLFNNDNYKQPLSAVVKNYYVVADYDSKYRFNKFITVNLTNGKTGDITVDHDISFDSYIQGVHNNAVYLFDKDTKKQYEINLAKKSILEVGNEQDDIKIYNGNEITRIKASEAKNSNVLFDSKDHSLKNQSYDKIYKFGGANSGFYYLFIKDENKYHVYRTNVQNTDQITYLFDTTDINRIVYVDDYIYYINNDTINYFKDNLGTKKVIQYNELQFNEYLKFSIYSA